MIGWVRNTGCDTGGLFVALLRSQWLAPGARPLQHHVPELVEIVQHGHPVEPRFQVVRKLGIGRVHIGEFGAAERLARRAAAPSTRRARWRRRWSHYTTCRYANPGRRRARRSAGRGLGHIREDHDLGMTRLLERAGDIDFERAEAGGKRHLPRGVEAFGRETAAPRISRARAGLPPKLAVDRARDSDRRPRPSRRGFRRSARIIIIAARRQSRAGSRRSASAAGESGPFSIERAAYSSCSSVECRPARSRRPVRDRGSGSTPRPGCRHGLRESAASKRRARSTSRR